MKKVNFLGLIQHFLFSKSLFNKGSTKSIHCDSVDSFGIYNPPRKQPVKTANFASNLLAKGELATVTGCGTAKKPPREQAVKVASDHCSQQLMKRDCYLVSGGNTAKKPPREQSVEASPMLAPVIPTVISQG